MLGRNPGWVTTQGEILADLFSAEGWDVLETSTQPRRALRLVDTICCLVRWRRSVDLVVISVFSGPAFVMADVTSLLCWVLRLPTILVLRGGNLPEHAARFPRWTRRVIRRGDAVVAPSPFLTEGLAADVTTEIIPNVVDLAAIPHRERRAIGSRLLWMRTFHPIYNPSMAVRALSHVRESRPEVTLTMAGQEKAATEQVRAAVSELGVDDAVDLVGFLDVDGKRDAFDGHDVYLHTNHVDNTPVSALEAAAAGLPVVATAVGGIPHLFEHEVTALLVPDDDDDAMARAVLRLLDDPSLAGTLSRNGRALAEASAWPRVRQQWIELFARLVPASR